MTTLLCIVNSVKLFMLLLKIYFYNSNDIIDLTWLFNVTYDSNAVMQV